MATYDYVDRTTNADYHGKGVLATQVDKHFMWKRNINLATAGDEFTSTGAFGANDILQIFDVFEGILIQGVAIEVTTVEGATLAAEIGDGDDADGFLVAADLNSATWQHGYTNATYAADYCDGTTYHNGKLYITADTIDLKLVTISADVAILDVYVYGIDFRPVA